MDKNRLRILLNKYRDNACTDLELQELEQWYSSLNTGSEPIETNDVFANEMLLQFRHKLAATGNAPVIAFYRKKLFRIAAAAAVILIVGLTVTLSLPKGNKDSIVNTEQPVDITAPASTKAYITLSDGRKISLDDLQNGTVATDAGITISKQGDKIIYGDPQSDVQLTQLNTLTVPKGSKPFKLLLADGSEMWLDAATTVTYPNVFVGNQRKVEIITGQTYFEVAPNASMPFIAKKGDVEVQVLGTHFNISAFDNEKMKVTLLEGSVKVSNNGQALTIKSGEQVVSTQNSPLKTLRPDMDEVMAWKNGNFQFEGADINAVMKQLERWYDVEVEVRGNINAHFGGTISRDVNMSKVFEMLKLTGEVNYKIDGRKIIVTP